MIQGWSIHSHKGRHDRDDIRDHATSRAFRFMKIPALIIAEGTDDKWLGAGYLFLCSSINLHLVLDYVTQLHNLVRICRFHCFGQYVVVLRESSFDVAHAPLKLYEYVASSFLVW